MALIGVKGNKYSVNNKLLLYAFERPTLFLDCANCANPHSLFPEIPQEKLEMVYVISAEVIYRFRDAILKLDFWCKKLGIKNIVITTYSGLFNYGNEEENYEVYVHSWELLDKLSEKYDIVIGVEENTVHEELGKKYCDGTYSLESKDSTGHTSRRIKKLWESIERR